METETRSHTNLYGEIARKFGNTEVRTIRNMYGKGLAAGFPECAKLHQLIGRVDEIPLALLRKHYEDGSLERRIHEAGG